MARAGCGDPPAPLNASLPNVLIIGDSISMGEPGYSLYVKSLLRRPGYELAQVQHSGGFGGGGQAADTKNGMACIDHWLGGNMWDVITVNFGIHDCNAGNPEYNPPEVYSQNLKTILSNVRNATRHAFFVTTTPNGGVFHPECIVEYNELALQITEELGINVVDLNAYVHGYCGANYTLCPIQLDNNVHFTTRPPRPSGQQYTALAVARAVLDALPVSSSNSSVSEVESGGTRTTGCGRPPTALSTEKPNVLIIGDSISGDLLGYGPLVRDILELRSGPEGMANGSLAAVQHNGGWTADGATPEDQQAGSTTVGVKCIESWLGNKQWDAISFNFGIHDCEAAPQFTKPDVYRANLESIARSARSGLKKGGTLIWTSTTPPPFPEATDKASVACVNQRNAIAKEALLQFNVVVNDLHAEMNAACGINFTSCSLQLHGHNVHPTPVGRQFLAIKTASVIAPFLNVKGATFLPQHAQDDVAQMSDLEHPAAFIV